MARPRRDHEIEYIRGHIVEAATHLFAEKGYESTSVQAIAEAAGYSGPTLYTYFKGKQAIFEALMLQVASESGDLFNVESPKGMDFRHRLELLLRHQHQWVDRRRDAFLVLMRRGSMGPTEEGDGAGDNREVWVSQMTQWLAENDAARHLPGADLDDAAHILWGIGLAFFLRWLSNPDDGFASQTPRIVDYFLNGVLGAAQAPIQE